MNLLTALKLQKEYWDHYNCNPKDFIHWLYQKGYIITSPEEKSQIGLNAENLIKILNEFVVPGFNNEINDLKKRIETLEQLVPLPHKVKFK